MEAITPSIYLPDPAVVTVLKKKIVKSELVCIYIIFYHLVEKFNRMMLMYKTQSSNTAQFEKKFRIHKRNIQIKLSLEVIGCRRCSSAHVLSTLYKGSVLMPVV